jgi:hypothetical protein
MAQKYQGCNLSLSRPNFGVYNVKFGHILFFLIPPSLKFCIFSSTLTSVSSANKILRENHQDSIFFYAVSICAGEER